MSKNINKNLINKIRTILLIKTSEEKYSDNNFKINSKTIKELNEKYDINNIEITINNPQISGFNENYYYGNKCCSLKEVNFFLYNNIENNQKCEENNNENIENSLNNSDKLHLRKKYVVHGENGKEKKLEEKINNNNKTEIIAIRFLKNLAKKFIDVDLIKNINKKNYISFKDSKLKKIKENFEVKISEKINKIKPKINYEDERKITKTKTFVNLIDEKQKFFLFKQNSTLLSEIKHKRKNSKSIKKVKKKTLKKIRQNKENYIEIKHKESTDDETIEGKIIKI